MVALLKNVENVSKNTENFLANDKKPYMNSTKKANILERSTVKPLH